MRLFIAEKPSLARAIADALPAPRKRTRTHIECGAGDIVAWCAGHILKLAPPEAYADEYATWRLEHLPIVPRDWRLEASVPELLKAIARLLKTAERVVHAGDPDREGQLLVDEVLHFLGYRGPVDRLLVRDLSPQAVRRQLGALEPNATYRRLYESALARQRADWLYGLNMTRLYTLLGRAAGYEGVLSVGRVQTPLLGLIVARDRAIAEFRPVPYYVVAAEVRAGGGERFRAVWVPGAAVKLDPEGRLLAREVAVDVRRRVLGREGYVAGCAVETKSQAAPLPYSLADLQVEAGRRLRMSAQEVLDACQRLYEVHRVLTYPRSDCAHLPEGHHGQAADVLAAIGKQAPAFGPAILKADLTLRSKAWNDKKVTAHHAIVPTAHVAREPLSAGDRAVYELVARRYLAQFYLPHEFRQTTVKLAIAGECFTAAGRQVVADGWKALVDDSAEDAAGRGPGGDPAGTPPRACRRSSLATWSLRSTSRWATSAPSRPSPSTTPRSSRRCAAWRSSCATPPSRRSSARPTALARPRRARPSSRRSSSAGTSSGVKRAIVSTETGRALVRSLPEVATTPDMTATWEAAIRAIAEGTQTLDAFLVRVEAQLEQLVAEGRALGRVAVPAGSPAPHPARRAAHRPVRGGSARPRPLPHSERQKRS